MYLVLDLGNTNQKIGLFDGDRLIRLEQHDRLKMGILKDVLEEFPEIRSGIVSSVVPFPGIYKNYLRKRLDYFLELTGKTPVPLVNLYKNPARLGKDRLACAVAGSRLFEGFPVLVVNAGTCITYDLVNAQNEYLGGAISPGLAMRLKVMHTFTSKLPLVTLTDPETMTGDTTRSSMLSGAVNGTAAEVKGMILKYRKLYPGLQVILSGGDMEFLEKLLKIRIFAFPNIVLIGLKHILEFNLQHAR
ncbi:MAG: type III pantothenate kinase [bacterium]